MARRVKKTKHYSWKIGDLAKGCQHCIKGDKLVLFITGICSRKCYYCPISEQKKDKDNTWANERKIIKKQDILEEADVSSAKGAGITGGDPLLKMDRTVSAIRNLKKKFGKDFHIHLYTSLEYISPTRLNNLERAGLDEIRFHPDLGKPEEWKKLEITDSLKIDCGVEIPIIPGKKKETIALIDYIKKLKNIRFLNMNELEMSDNNSNQLAELGYHAKDKRSYGVKGSEELAKQLLRHCAKKTKLNVHYCTAKLKDSVQLSNRLLKRSKKVKRIFDKVTKEGLLIRGAVYIKELVPGFDYRLTLETINKKPLIKKLYKLKRSVQVAANIPNDMIDVDKEKVRLITKAKYVKKGAAKIKKLKLIPAIVEEYPTFDALEIEVNFL